MPETLVEMKNITKTFPGVKALDDAQLTLYKGEVLGLLGENGAGKSTLMNVLGGVYIPDSGSISIDGKEAKITNVVDAQNLGVAFIHQEITFLLLRISSLEESVCQQEWLIREKCMKKRNSGWIW